MERYKQILNRGLTIIEATNTTNIWLNPDAKYTPLESLYNSNSTLGTAISSLLIPWDLKRYVSRGNHVDVFREGIKTLNAPLNSFNSRKGDYYSGKSSLKILNSRVLNSGCSIPLRGSELRFMIFNGAVFMLENESTRLIPLFVICADKQYSRYVRQCLLLKKAIHPKALKVFQNSNFDVPRGLAPSLRRLYRKDFKEVFIKMGVEIEIVDNFDEIFIRHQLPKAQGLGGYKQILETESKEFFTTLKAFNQHGPGNGFSVEF